MRPVSVPAPTSACGPLVPRPGIISSNKAICFPSVSFHCVYQPEGVFWVTPVVITCQALWSLARLHNFRLSLAVLACSAYSWMWISADTRKYLSIWPDSSRVFHETFHIIVALLIVAGGKLFRLLVKVKSTDKWYFAPGSVLRFRKTKPRRSILRCHFLSQNSE